MCVQVCLAKVPTVSKAPALRRPPIDGEFHMSHEALLRALPTGGHIWLRVGGRSLWPLVLDADHLFVERCDASGLRRGDIAIVTWPEHSLVGHIVVDLDPLITSSIVGVRDPLGAEVLGKAIALRRGERRIDLPTLTAQLLRWVPDTALTLKRVPGVRAVVNLIRRGR